MSETKIPFSLRLSADEHRTLKEAAGSQSMANFARARLFDGNSKPRKKRGLRPVKDREALGRVLGMLGASDASRNLRTLAEAAETGCLLVDANTLAQLSSACADISAMREDIMNALGVRTECSLRSLTAAFRQAAE